MKRDCRRYGARAVLSRARPYGRVFRVTGADRHSLDLHRGPRGATLTVNLLTILYENCSLLLGGTR
jgi:hypothetical protein